MYWTLELASKLEDAPWPASRDELIDYAQRSGAPIEVIETLQEMEDAGELYESIEDIWPDYPLGSPESGLRILLLSITAVIDDEAISKPSPRSRALSGLTPRGLRLSEPQRKPPHRGACPARLLE